MSRFTWLAAAAAIALSATACAGDGDDMVSDTMSGTADTLSPSTAPAPPAHTTPEAAMYTDEQLRSFAAASREINPIAGTLSTATPEQRASATDQIRAILQRNNLDAQTYNAIAARAQSDPSFAERIRSVAN